jgi:hypothetical protein
MSIALMLSKAFDEHQADKLGLLSPTPSAGLLPVETVFCWEKIYDKWPTVKSHGWLRDSATSD